jgi:hypothetical protein
VYPNNSITEDELKEYGITFLEDYKRIIKFSNLTDNDKENIPFYQNYPYNIGIGISSVHGIAIEFVSSDNKTIQSNFDDIKIVKFNDRLEDIFWPKGSEFYISGQPYLEVENKMNMCDGFIGAVDIIIESNGILEVQENCTVFSYGPLIKRNNGSVHINGTLIIQTNENSLIFKGKKDRILWSKERAKVDADIVSFKYIDTIFLREAKITNSSVLTSLENQATIISNKLRNGEYYTESNKFKDDEYDSDKKKYFEIALDGNVKTEAAKSFLDSIEKANPPKDIFTKINEYPLVIKLGIIYSLSVILIKIFLLLKCIIKHNKSIKEFKECFRSLNLNLSILKDFKEIFRK